MICKIPSSLIAGFIKPMPMDSLSSISGNTLSLDLQASLFLMSMGFLSSSASSLRDIFITGSSVRFSHKMRDSSSIYEFHVGHYSLPFMDAPQNSFS